INLHRYKLAQDLMTQYVLTNDINIAIISEPYRVLDSWFADLNNDAAIWISSETTDSAKRINTLSREAGIVAVEIDELRIFSCYFSPNTSIGKLQDSLMVLEREITKHGTDSTIVAGDLNAKSTTWGSKVTDRRGLEVLEMINRTNLTAIRSKVDYTFERGRSRSLIDILLRGRDCVASLSKSEILKVYTASDHLYLRHVFSRISHDTNPMQRAVYPLRTQIKVDVLSQKYHEWAWSTNFTQVQTEDDIDNYIYLMTRLIEKSSKKLQHPPNRRARRTLQRARAKKAPSGTIDGLNDKYKEMRKKLKVAIQEAENESWTSIIKTVDQDPWGRPYRWVVNKIRGKLKPILLSSEQITDTIRKLFVITPNSGEDWDEEYPPIHDIDATDDPLSE
ncbi:uncharacterized protein LOC144477875, partial [Augochlora pura]